MNFTWESFRELSAGNNEEGGQKMKKTSYSIVRGGKPALSACRPAEKFRQHYQKGTTYSGGYGGGQTTYEGYSVQRTRFDSIAMKENIALSMADVLTFNSSVFVKNYGRATLSTVAFRGTSPSHTQVTWNGMRINNPMLGMTDFSTIPSYFMMMPRCCTERHR